MPIKQVDKNKKYKFVCSYKFKNLISEINYLVYYSLKNKLIIPCPKRLSLKAYTHILFVYFPDGINAA